MVVMDQDPRPPAENKSRLEKCFADVFGAKALQQMDSLSFGSVAWDSVSHVALVTEMETAFEIELTPEDITELTGYPHAKTILRRHGIAIE